MERLFFAASGAFGFLSVALGAFGAHALRTKLAGLEDGAKRLEWWQTATQYLAIHALAMALAAYLVGRTSSGAATAAGWGFAIGNLLFAGSLYTMTLTGVRALGAVTPLGGVAYLVGWACVVVAAMKV
jgi:uncharacterized membrane protein YgdD (TMEM256/DUF423 family)